MQRNQEIFKQYHTSEAISLPLADYIDKTVDVFHQFYIDNPGFIVIAFYLRSQPEIQAVSNDHNRLIINELANFFMRYNPQLAASTSQLIAKIMFEVVTGLQTFALMNPEEAPQVIAEMKKVGFGYLEPYLGSRE